MKIVAGGVVDEAFLLRGLYHIEKSINSLLHCKHVAHAPPKHAHTHTHTHTHTQASRLLWGLVIFTCCAPSLSGLIAN